MKINAIISESNMRQVSTQKGTKIKRFGPWGVGKDIGGFVYLHRMYVRGLPDNIRARIVDAENHIYEAGFHINQFNTVKIGKNVDNITFILSPDFDTEPEPTSAEWVLWNGETVRTGKSNQIWHHKWLWVKDDYPAFDVEESVQRSQEWLKIPDIEFSRIGKRETWERDYVPKIGKY